MKSLAKLSMRVLSLVLIVKSLITIVNYVTLTQSPMANMADNTFKNGIYFNILPLLLTIAIAILLWVLSDKLAMLMIDEDDEVISWNIDYNQLFSIILKVSGIIIITYAFPAFITNTFNTLPYLRYMSRDMFHIQYINLILTPILVPIIQILIGYLLFAKTRFFIK